MSWMLHQICNLYILVVADINIVIVIFVFVFIALFSTVAFIFTFTPFVLWSKLTQRTLAQC